MMEKKDYEDLLKQLEMQYKNMILAKEQDEWLMEFCKKRISEFSEEKKDIDLMPEEIKNLAREMTK